MQTTNHLSRDSKVWEPGMERLSTQSRDFASTRSASLLWRRDFQNNTQGRSFPRPREAAQGGWPFVALSFSILFVFLSVSFFLSVFLFILSFCFNGQFFLFRLAWVPIQFYVSLGFTSLWPFGLVKEIQDFFHKSAMSGVDLSIITGISVLNRPLRAETLPLILHLIAICRGEFFIQQPTHSLSLKRTFSLLSKNLSMFVMVPEASSEKKNS